MSSHPSRIVHSLIAPMFVGSMLFIGAAPADAQQPGANPTAADDQTLFIGSINGDSVYVRCGAGESYYPFYKVNRGDLVKVTGERFGWTRVAVVGPAFRDAFGYVRYPKGDTSKVRLGADNTSAVTLGRVDILAPNLEANNQAKDSWKTLVRLEADQTMRVIEASDDGKDMLLKVAVPITATGWISTPLVPRASDEEAEMFAQMLTAKPASTPTQRNSATDAPTSPANAVVASDVTPPPVIEPIMPDAQLQQDDLPVAQAPTPTDAPATTAPATQVADKPRETTLEDLESAFKALQRQPIETAEVMPLRDLYLKLAENHPTDQRIQRYAQTRAKQLEIWQEVQVKKLEVAAARDRMKMTVQEADAVRTALERSAEYTAVGRVAASTIYDGHSLPKLFRLQDPATGRTIAYLKPDADYALANRIDIIVGIVGDKAYEDALRLNIITPRRIDVLSPDSGAPSTVATGASDSEDK